MKLEELITKLQGKPNQKAEVEFMVWEKKTGTIVCIDLSGPATTEIMRVMAKHAPK